MTRRIHKASPHKPLLISYFGAVCWYCGVSADAFHTTNHFLSGLQIDHIIPQSYGGTDELTNLALACGFCNRAKSSWGIDEFYRWLKHVRSTQTSHYDLEGPHPSTNLWRMNQLKAVI